VGALTAGLRQDSPEPIEYDCPLATIHCV
jgi:hypothetical protein